MMDTFVFLVATARMYSFVQIQLARVDAVGVDDHSSVRSGGWHQLVPLGTTMSESLPSPIRPDAHRLLRFARD